MQKQIWYEAEQFHAHLTGETVASHNLCGLTMSTTSTPSGLHLMILVKGAGTIVPDEALGSPVPIHRLTRTVCDQPLMEVEQRCN